MLQNYSCLSFLCAHEFSGSCTIRPKAQQQNTNSEHTSERKSEPVSVRLNEKQTLRLYERWTYPIKLKLEHPSHFLNNKMKPMTVQSEWSPAFSAYSLSPNLFSLCSLFGRCFCMFFAGNLCVDSEKWQTM